ncbi:polyribonucleotide nucleotidyltransferase [Buchnera aphidicola]|uniref:Polyribonucleotide nucleotidyltransferase n=1 Tax=Buchnera aphidicola subsp. Tuberolachnus salignus TaxID=98804 RepID=A0A160SYW7_BUCTT|nr:polyribonucleotide nucleotidyltransferase [Buchnera aphidicola]CUR53221.1 Polyribonucleotide nucleotidyltransferase [Buchnera aphidicola (Tuberolachnus salignus)]
MLNPITHKFLYGKNIITLETGVIARQATTSILASMDDTTVLVTVVGKKIKQNHQKFFPLTINYQERTYAAGRIPGGFFRREGRPSENEILIARLIDRPLRPLFPKGLLCEIQIIITLISLNPDINPDVISLIGTSAALNISDFPFLGPIGVARVGYINKKFVLNPTTENMKNSALDLIISGTKKTILMIEAEAKILTEEKILKAISFGHQQQNLLLDNIVQFSKKTSIIKKNNYLSILNYNSKLYKFMLNFLKDSIKKAYLIHVKLDREKKLQEIKENLIEYCNLELEDVSIYEIEEYFFLIERNIFRKKILKENWRIDGRNFDMVRSLNVKTGLLSRVHGSALFTRGDTQALVSTTLGTSRDAQNLDDLLGDRIDNFLFHYNFPPYSVGEIGIVGSPKRREIGHGKLAKRSLLAVMPKIDNFPYTIRIVSEITESNGSSSMASVCGASLSLMDAGVPIKSSVAGIAMGLIKEKEKYVILSDILGEEDYFGDMDLKVAGNYQGITALQMDVKITDFSINILKKVLLQAKESRFFILNFMEKSIHMPRRNISKFAPRIHIIKINPEKIKDVIGKGGAVIRMLTEETGTVIEIQDDGTVKISAAIESKAKHAIRRIEEITAEIEIGKIYSGRVIRIVEFGAFVSIGTGKEGLVHISQIGHKRIEKVTDYLSLNQKISVKVLEIDRNGRLRLSMKSV